MLTTDTLEQALARAGGAAGNKGHEAAEAALTLADVAGPAQERLMLRAETKARARALQMLYAREAGSEDDIGPAWPPASRG